MSDTQPWWPLPAEDIESVRRLKARLEEIAEAIGSWTAKSDNRQTGVSYHAKFANKVDIIQAMQYTKILEESPSLLAWALEVILAAQPVLKVEGNDKDGYRAVPDTCIHQSTVVIEGLMYCTTHEEIADERNDGRACDAGDEPCTLVPVMR